MVGSDRRQQVKPDALEQFEVLIPTAQVLSQFDDLVGPVFNSDSNLEYP